MKSKMHFIGHMKFTRGLRPSLLPKRLLLTHACALKLTSSNLVFLYAAIYFLYRNWDVQWTVEYIYKYNVELYTILLFLREEYNAICDMRSSPDILPLGKHLAQSIVSRFQDVFFLYKICTLKNFQQKSGLS